MDHTGWLEFFTEGLATQLRAGASASSGGTSWRASTVSDRQALALGRALEAGRLGIQELEALCPEANRRTLQRDIKALVAKGLLVEGGTSPTDPTRHYVLAEPIRDLFR